MSEAKNAAAAKAAKEAKPAKPAKAAKAAKAARTIGTLAVMLAVGLAAGCATNLTRTPILSEGAGGETVVAYATNVKLGLGTKEATSIGTYKLSATGGLDIAGLDERTDSTAVLLRGMELGAQIANQRLGGGTLAASAPAVESAATEVTGDTATATATTTAFAPRSAICADGGPAVVIIGNRATCSRCRKLWSGLDTDALAAALCSTSIIDADKTDNPAEDAARRPATVFEYPLIRVYAADGALAGEFSGNGLTQQQLVDKVKALVPSCGPVTAAAQ
jgi:hypothetical protein